MRTAIISLLICVGAVGSCEPPKSKNPLSAPASAKADLRLNGLWRGDVNGSFVSLHVVPKEGAAIDLVLVGEDGTKGAFGLTFDAFPSNIGGQSYLNLRAKTFKGEYADSAEIGSEYIFAAYEIGKNGALMIGNMSAKLVEDAIKAGTLKGTSDERVVHLTAESSALAAFVQSADASKLFDKPWTFKRVDR